MKTSTALVVLGMLWAVTVNAAAAKHSEDFFFRQLRSPFERKLKGTRRGCSAYGHSCFGGYGKRAGGGGGGLLLAAPLPLPPQQQQQREAPAEAMDKNPEDTPEAAEAAELDGDPGRMRGLRDDAALIVLRQSPVSSRTPLWGRAAAARALHGDLDDGVGLAAAAVRGVDSGEDEDPVSATASRLFLRRWLRTYRRPSDRVPL